MGQAYYGAAYRPNLRPLLEQVFKNDTSSYFRRNRIGAQAIYQPCETVLGHSLSGSVDEIEMVDVKKTATFSTSAPSFNLPKAGEIVLVQGQKNSPPYLGLTLSTARNGSIRLVTDGWKAALRPLSMLQLLPGIQCQDWLQEPDEVNRVALKQWRTQLELSWVDLFLWWKRIQTHEFTYASLCRDLGLTTDDERLGWGLELLAHGSLLFRRNGERWTPFDAPRIESNDGFVHHLQLLDAGAGAKAQVNGRLATLTGQSNWRFFEVKWCECVEEVECEPAQARSSAIRLV